MGPNANDVGFKRLLLAGKTKVLTKKPLVELNSRTELALVVAVDWKLVTNKSPLGPIANPIGADKPSIPAAIKTAEPGVEFVAEGAGNPVARLYRMTSPVPVPPTVPALLTNIY